MKRSTHRSTTVSSTTHMRNRLDLHNKDVDHLANKKLGNLCNVLNSLDHVDLPRRHNKDVDDHKGTSTTLSTGNR